jgi:hypothetical protein
MDILAYGEAMVEFNQTGEGDGLLYLQGFGGDSSNFAIAAAFAAEGAQVVATGAAPAEVESAAAAWCPATAPARAPGPCCSWPAHPRASSPAWCCRWMAAT